LSHPSEKDPLVNEFGSSSQVGLKIVSQNSFTRLDIRYVALRCMTLRCVALPSHFASFKSAFQECPQQLLSPKLKGNRRKKQKLKHLLIVKCPSFDGLKSAKKKHSKFDRK
jgi:hypothetical protein